MAEIEKLTGHGAPSVLLPGSKGQIYEDLDTGRLYECKGERGFIRVDGDDQDNQFNWVLKGVDISYNDLQDKPEQGGSTGGGVFIVNFTIDPSNKTTALPDKTLDELHNAVDRGDRVIGMLGTKIFFERIPNNKTFDACGIKVDSSRVIAFAFEGHENNSEEMGWFCDVFNYTVQTVQQP